MTQSWRNAPGRYCGQSAAASTRLEVITLGYGAATRNSNVGVNAHAPNDFVVDPLPILAPLLRISRAARILGFVASSRTVHSWAVRSVDFDGARPW